MMIIQQVFNNFYSRIVVLNAASLFSLEAFLRTPIAPKIAKATPFLDFLKK